MDEIKSYTNLKEFAVKNNIGILELVKIFEINSGAKLNPCDTRMLTNGWAHVSDDKTHLVLTKKASDLIAIKGPTLENKALPILSLKSGAFVKSLAGNLMKDKLTSTELENLTKYCKNPLALPFLFLFLQIFPTADKKKNADWEKLFRAEYKSVTLRKISFGTARKFEKILKTKDIGIFLAGTYQHVTHSYSTESGQYYPRSIENYLNEWEYWYDNAELTLHPEVKDKKDNSIISFL